jgi:hypothetical protein
VGKLSYQFKMKTRVRLLLVIALYALTVGALKAEMPVGILISDKTDQEIVI